MALDKRAQIGATPQFIEHLRDALEFFRLQDAHTSSARYKRLKLAIKDCKETLAWAPACGRPAQLLCSQEDVNNQILAETLVLAKANRLPFLREILVDQHIILYAHSATKVLLMALKHQKELRFFSRLKT